ncbi:MAG: metal ABC transporter permease [Candidatus Aminicenantales bacterium]
MNQLTLLWSYGFGQRAILAGVAIAISSALLGLFLLLRREAMIGHGLGHLIFGALALAFFLRLSPLPVAIGIAVVASGAMLRLKARAGLHGDAAIAIFSSVGMATGVVLVTLVNRFGVDLLSYLFGDILAVDAEETILAIILSLAVIFFVAYFYHQLLFLTFSPEAAKASGLKTGNLETGLVLLTAITVVLGMKIVGLLLMTSLLVIPAAASLQGAKSFLAACLMAPGMAILSVIVGLWLAFAADLPAGATIVLFSFGLFLLSFFQKRRRLF